MELKGIHHVSAITANAKNNYHFHTDILGMCLVKKTINQNDPSGIGNRRARLCNR